MTLLEAKDHSLLSLSFFLFPVRVQGKFTEYRVSPWTWDKRETRNFPLSQLSIRGAGICWANLLIKGPQLQETLQTRKKAWERTSVQRSIINHLWWPWALEWNKSHHPSSGCFLPDTSSECSTRLAKSHSFSFIKDRTEARVWRWLPEVTVWAEIWTHVVWL